MEKVRRWEMVIAVFERLMGCQVKENLDSFLTAVGLRTKVEK